MEEENIKDVIYDSTKDIRYYEKRALRDMIFTFFILILILFIPFRIMYEHMIEDDLSFMDLIFLSLFIMVLLLLSLVGMENYYHLFKGQFGFIIDDNRITIVHPYKRYRFDRLECIILYESIIGGTMFFKTTDTEPFVDIDYVARSLQNLENMAGPEWYHQLLNTIQVPDMDRFIQAFIDHNVDFYRTKISVLEYYYVMHI